MRDVRNQGSNAGGKDVVNASSGGPTTSSVPAISLPKGGGAIRGIGEKFAANPVTGTGSLSIPIYASPGRSGFGPQLSLSYDSGSGNGAFGFGWNLSIPSITRKTDKGLPRYKDATESDVFILSGSEDLVPVLIENLGESRPGSIRLVDGKSYLVQRYRPRIEGLFARIERWTSVINAADSFWRSISRDNITTFYGKTDESRICDPHDPRRIFSWLICESYDDKGNAIVYEYAREDSGGVDLSQAHERNRTAKSRSANCYPKRIKYGNQTSRLVEPNLQAATWLFELVFDYEEGHYEALLPDAELRQFVRASKDKRRDWSARQDAFSTHRAAFEVRTYRLCHRVLMFHHFPELGTNDYLVRSTEFGYDQSSVASFITSVTQSGYVRVADGSYLKKSLPPLEFEYTKAMIQDKVREIDAESLENLPAGLDGDQYQWVDLDGEGLSGILSEQAGVWFYKPNLGQGHFANLQTLGALPSDRSGTGQKHQFLDLAGDGQLDVVHFNESVSGFYERTDDGQWHSFTTFRSLPNLDWGDSNLRFVDLTGDGHADILITENDAFTWFPSLAEEGFGPSELARKALDEEKGPKLVFADGAQSVYLADMSGDGLTDLVRVRNGEVCYWPNLGYGRFGAKITMDRAPRFDNPDQFDQQRLRLADIDGSGTTDIIYLGRDGVRLYFNQSGNWWSEPRRLGQFPPADNLSSVMTADLLGNGTACLIWSSPLPASARQAMRFIDLMGGQKPHLLIRSVNNLGAETLVTYAPSTKFYLADKLAGKPWVTKTPFPIHVVERVETYDHVSGNRFVTRYAYHHGYFDGVEREFRGFGMVEQWDTEEFAALSESGAFPRGANVDQSSHVPPALTRTWFHTGIHLGREHVSNFLVGEYYRDTDVPGEEAKQLLLEDTVLPESLTVDEEREACRALKGSMLRQEVYGLDGTDKERHPYTVIEQNFTIRRLQPRAGHRYAVFFTHPCESISYHYERDPADPRITHTLTLEADEFGNILKSAAVSYGRRHSDATLESRDQNRQSERLIIYTENDVTNAIEGDDEHRAPLACQTRTYELTGYEPSGVAGRFQPSDFVQRTTDGVKHKFDSEIQYEEKPGTGKHRRLIEQVRTLYRSNKLDKPLPLGKLESLALPFESYKLAFTPGLLAVYGGRVSDIMMATEGRYVHSEGDLNWWIPSGQVFYSHDPTDTAAKELSYAQRHFYIPHRYRDPFHTALVSAETLVRYDAYDLLVEETRDPLGNCITVGERDIDPTKPLIRQGQDYRVLQPALVMDPNRNRAAVAFDALGLVAGTAVMGKPDETPVPGDKLAATFQADLTQTQIDQFFANPKGTIAATLLDDATTRIVYDLTKYSRESDPNKKLPVFAATLARETHVKPTTTGGLKIQVSFSYSDGFGRENQKKIQAEAGPVPKRDSAGRIITVDGQPEMTTTDVSPRWVGSGWTVFNNKGKPVRQYEPFFTDLHQFESEPRIGDSSVLFYDPAERVVGTLHPNHTWEKVVFDPWKQATWDLNDTVTREDPKNDPDLGGYFRRLPPNEYLPTWHDLRTNPAHAVEAAKRWPDPKDRDAEAKAARKAAVHSETPTLAYLDALGRTFLTVAQNKFKRSDALPADPPTRESYRTRILFDIEGNQREIIDARDHVVMRYDFDMLSNRVHQKSSDAGERWMLSDVAGKPIYAWDNNDNQFRTAYDQLRRPVASYMKRATASELQIGRTVYGEATASPEANNLRVKTVEVFDQAGVVTTDKYDFKGNPLRTQRQLAREYKKTLDWSATVPLETATYTTSTSYDALNRPTEMTTPDNSVISLVYNEANLLEQIGAKLRGASSATTFITDIDYDAKGQRTLIDFGNRVRTTYKYDLQTFRLIHLMTTRDDGQLQNLHYTYDPAGNITSIRDDAQQTVYFNNRRVEPSAEYTYDAIYRLIEATGREHLGGAGHPTAPDAFNGFHTRLDHPGDGNAMGTYVERYVYDAVGNILSMLHRGSDPAHAGWKRCYQYATDSNRLLSTSNPADPHNPDDPCAKDYSDTPFYAEKYEYDAHGNMTRMPHLPLMQWDYLDQLQATSKQVVTTGTPVITWYAYDTSGQRVRKVTESEAVAPATPARKAERIYIGGFEVYREYNGGGTTVTLERETLHIIDGKQRVALVETRTDTPSPEQLIRYQFSNHLGSASLELDERAQIISYEEYYPYGSTSYQAARSKTEASKRYRYTGKELDEETGLYYHGARYYAVWLTRWASADPQGMLDGFNVFSYCRANPIGFSDPGGTNRVDSIMDFAKQHPDAHVADSKQASGKPPSESAPSVEYMDMSDEEGIVIEKPETEQEKNNKIHKRELEKHEFQKREIEKYEAAVREPLPIDTLVKTFSFVAGAGLGLAGGLATGATLLASALSVSGGMGGAKLAGTLADRVLPKSGDSKSIDPNIREFFVGLAELGGGVVGGLGGSIIGNKIAPPTGPVFKGTNLTQKGDGFGVYAGRAEPIPGYTDVIIHGSLTEFARTPGGASLNHRILARWIKGHPDYTGGPIRLISCNTGAYNATAAMHLANKLHVPVMAPTDVVWAFSSGKLVVGPTPTTPTGSWVVYKPGGP